MASNYQLLDFGHGEKLEQFGQYRVRRPSLYARGKRKNPQLWDNVPLRFDTQTGWISNGEIDLETLSQSGDWHVEFQGSCFRLKPTPVGHIGVFPEQQTNWDWIQRDLGKTDGKGLKAINLFAYTGGTSMALARCGIQTVHVDGASNTVKWARDNAKRSGLADAPIRWIAEDVMTFVTREVSRGNTYDILIADPPSFGRGPKKQQWRIARDFPKLLSLIPELMPNPKAIILSCHTDGYEYPVLKKMLTTELQDHSGTERAMKLTLPTSDGRHLESGDCVRWKRTEANEA